MVRGGGRLFLDLGRRVERAQAVADELACALELPGADTQPALVEHGLRLALELRDSVITYRSRYSGVLQPAPALDLMLADPGNPRGLAFQLVTAATLLNADRRHRRTPRWPASPRRCWRSAEAMVRAWPPPPTRRAPRPCCRRGYGICAIRWPSCRTGFPGGISPCCPPRAVSA